MSDKAWEIVGSIVYLVFAVIKWGIIIMIVMAIQSSMP